MEPILLTFADRVAHLRFNRPERLNALDLATTEAFQVAAERIVADPAVRVVVLSGEGRAFVAGGDLAFLHGETDREAAAQRLITPIHEGLKRIRQAGVLIVASVNGVAAGAGMSLALIADFTLAAETATFSLAYIKVAASPDCGGSWALSRLLGPRRALDLALRGDPLSAPQALQMGLINRVVTSEALEAETRSLAGQLAALPADAVARTRMLIEAAGANTFADHLDQERDAFAAGAGGEDFSRALDAFLQRHPPR